MLASVIPVRTAAVAATVGFLAIAAFQAALALGAPLGRAAWGGKRSELSTRLRIASGVSLVVWLVAAAIVLARAGFDVVRLPDAVARWGTWALVGILPLGALMNAASSSPWERFLWAPLALFLAVLCFVVARS